MRVLITGSREWDGPECVAIMADAMKGLPSDAVIVHGDARGADRMADYGANRLGLSVEKHPAEWNRRGAYYDKAAGYKRNEKMVSLGADVCFAFVVRDSLGNMSKGTQHCSDLALKAGIPVHYFEAGKDVQIVMPSVEAISVNPLSVGPDASDPWV